MAWGKQRIIEMLLRSHAEERRMWAGEKDSWAQERVSLLNRLQSPALAAYEATGEPSEVPLYVGPDDDEAHDGYIEDRENGLVQ